MAKLRLPRRFPPTREGWWFLVATLLVGAAALNGGINLLFLVFGMMLFLILASGVMSELCLRDLRVTRRPPTAIHAGAPYLMGIAVRNEKKKLPTFSLEVEDLLEGRPVDRRCYYLKLPAGRTQETAYRHVLHKRGVHRLSGFRIATRFPFGLIRKARDVDATAELLVYPALVPVPEALLVGLAADRGRQQATKPSRRGDFAGLREYRAGDDPRDIHWRSSARRGRLIVREAEDETGRTVIIALAGGADPAGRSATDDDGRTGATAAGRTRAGGRMGNEAAGRTSADGAAFEAAVSLAASLALTLLKRGLEVGLELPGGTQLPPGEGAPQSTAILRRLALVQPTGLPGGGEPLPATRRPTAPVTRVTITPAPGAPRVETSGPPTARRSA